MIHTILLQATPPAGGGMSTLLMFGMLFVVFYFFMIRPQMRKAKLEKQFKETIKKGDKVVTIGGVHGRILEVNDKTFILEIDTNTKVKIEKTAVSVEATKQYQQPTLPEKK
jgi:preprotein translocase subunit YajC